MTTGCSRRWPIGRGGSCSIRLFVRDRRTLGELEPDVAMTRFGVTKHLKVLEEAGLIVTRRLGREKLHFLNAVPIRLLHDR